MGRYLTEREREEVSFFLLLLLVILTLFGSILCCLHCTGCGRDDTSYRLTGEEEEEEEEEGEEGEEEEEEEDNMNILRPKISYTQVGTHNFKASSAEGQKRSGGGGD